MHSDGGLGKRTQRLGDTTFRSYAELPAALVLAAVLVALIAVWQLALVVGGSHTVVPHLFYVPLMLAAVRFGAPTATAVAAVAGLLAGPLLPADTETGMPQSTMAWVTRLLIFIGMALLLVWLTSHTRPMVLTRAKDAYVVAQLRNALRDGQIHAFYQPQFDMRTGRVVGMEALARWIHPVRGVIPPMEFIPAAERTGVIDLVDRHILREAVDQLAIWKRAGLDGLTMAVNLSPPRFQDPNLVSDVAEVLRTHDVPAKHIHLEITESAIISDVGMAARQIAALRQLGVRIAVDDFGAGQSSLSYFHEFGVDVVKIDQGFTAQLLDEPQVSRLVGGMIRLFDSLDVEVICEGISRAEHYVELQSLGCPVGQGFYLARPAPADEITTFLASSRQRELRRARRSS